MATFLFKTKGNSNPKGKPRVYFTCYPDDFEKYFEKICDDIFKTHDCVIYYTPDMKEEFDEQDIMTDLGQMNLFIVPVTFKLLTQKNRTMNVDLAYAKQENIPILPFMMESGLDEFYSMPNNFGERQYLHPNSSDITEIKYEDKLKKYLYSVLISDEMAQRIRAAFDAYIFLSYRKKDRRYANELMKMIHNIPQFRDIAIWYDEFLTPGESFKENISRALSESKLFALVVTPNILEKNNYVIQVEYPMAINADMDVVPVEMVETNKTDLAEKFKNIPECVSPHNTEHLNERLLDSLMRAAITENDKEPEHNFLIGLAYLDGIDVEVNRERAISLITSAADAGLLEAMEKLYNWYEDGSNVDLNYKKAVMWGEKCAEYCIRNFGYEDSKTLVTLNSLALTYGDIGQYQKELELHNKIYELRHKLYGDDHPDTLVTLNNIALTNKELGNSHKALEIAKKVYDTRCRVSGENHPDTIITLGNMAAFYGDLGDHKTALEIKNKVYELKRELYGDDHPDTLVILNNIALTYRELGDYHKALEIAKKVYDTRCRVSGENHPDTIITLGNMAAFYGDLGDHKTELEMQNKTYEFSCKLYGEDHPDTLLTLNNIAITYQELGDYNKALEIAKRVYDTRCRVSGENHPGTIIILDNMALLYGDLGDHKTALEMQNRVYEFRRKLYGDNHPDTLVTLNNLALTHKRLGDSHKALEIAKKVYDTRCRVSGENHPDTITILDNMSLLYGDLGNHKTALEMQNKTYKLRCELYGEDHPDTLTTLNNIALTHRELKDYHKALEIAKEVYDTRCKVLGEKHPQTLFALYNLAVYYEDLGDHKTSLEVYNKLYKFRCEVYGEDHPDTLLTLNNMAITYNQIKDYSKAFELIEKVYEKYCTIYGPKHQKTQKAKKNLDIIGENARITGAKIPKTNKNTDSKTDIERKLSRPKGLLLYFLTLIPLFVFCYGVINKITISIISLALFITFMILLIRYTRKYVCSTWIKAIVIAVVLYCFYGIYLLITGIMCAVKYSQWKNQINK